ncbi:MAG: tyrosine-type recombinase/integrase [Roseibium sp.]|nr:tyrosine-type recombinase/integrase [Roseibium sp.]
MIFKAKGIHRVRKRLANGAHCYYYYVVRGGPRFWKSDAPVAEDSPPRAFVTAYEAGRSRLRAGAEEPVHPLSLAQTISEYRASPKYRRLKPITKREYERAIEEVLAAFGKKRLSAFTKPQNRKRIKAWHWSFEDTPRQADMYLGMLVTILNFAVDQGDIPNHCADRIERLHEADHSNVIWLPEEQQALIDAAKLPSRYLIISAAFTGLRRKDVCAIPATADKGDHLNWWTSKSNERTEVVIPIVPEYRRHLDELKAYRARFEVPPMTLHCNSRGKPYTPDGLSSCFDDARSVVKIDKRFHDLRGTAVHNFIRANFLDDEIAEIVGWATKDVRAIRRKYADRATIVNAAIERLKRSSQ